MLKNFPIESYPDWAFLCLQGLGGGGGVFGMWRYLPADNSPKTIRCIPIKFSQVESLIKLNIRYTFVDMTTKCDDTMTSSVVKKIEFEVVEKSFFQDYFLLFRLTCTSYFINK